MKSDRTAPGEPLPAPALFGASIEGAEVSLLLAELRHFSDTLGQAEVSRIIGRPFDREFVYECLAITIVRRWVGDQLYIAEVRPTETLERALAALWSTG